MSPDISDPRRGAEAEAPCCISGCTETSVRSLARAEARKAYPDLSEDGRRAPLCRAHYKQYKKATKEARTLDRLGW
jgi:hypothetical protein